MSFVLSIEVVFHVPNRFRKRIKTLVQGLKSPNREDTGQRSHAERDQGQRVQHAQGVLNAQLNHFKWVREAVRIMQSCNAGDEVTSYENARRN